MFRRIPLTMLSEGYVLASAVHDDGLRLLLGPGMPISKDLMSGLHKRGIRDVVVAERDWRRLTAFSSQGKSRKALPRHLPVRLQTHTESSRELDAALEAAPDCHITPSENPFSQHIERRGATAYDRENMDAMLDHHQEAVEQVDELMRQLNRGGEVSAEAVRSVTGQALERARQDLDLFVCMGINPSESNEISVHSSNVSVLAVALGAMLNLDTEALTDLGMGCLVHNAGMLKIDEQLYKSPDLVNEQDFVEIAKHPVIATDMLYKNMSRVSLGVRMIVYQMHERCNGCGYPRGRTGETIHPLAKIAMVADAYVALVSKRPHRPAMLPYFAMTKMLEDVKDGLYDSNVVRALLHTVSLFPIGSFVELSDGRIGKTIRANGPNYDRPIVEVREKGSSRPSEIVDLSDEPLIRVVKALAQPN
ncbi:MAG: HD domain-containing protein [Planctomycetaceae bacterium]|nr:HD domain-containing protein [Planctomycetaceae bacterium]